MRTKKYVFLLLTLLCVFLCAFKVDTSSSLKELTHPYIDTYVCTRATLGEEDLLENFEFIKLTFLDDKEMEISYKKKGDKKRSHVYPYSFDDKTKEFSSEFGIMGYEIKENILISEGKFTISMPILSKQLILSFEAE